MPFPRCSVSVLVGLCWLSPAAAEPRPVVVELFTSQGCSSCPPADAYLGKLSNQPGSAFQQVADHFDLFVVPLDLLIAHFDALIVP